jgi:hypothetical protein
VRITRRQLRRIIREERGSAFNSGTVNNKNIEKESYVYTGRKRFK